MTTKTILTRRKFLSRLGYYMMAGGLIVLSVPKVFYSIPGPVLYDDFDYYCDFWAKIANGLKYNKKIVIGNNLVITANDSLFESMYFRR